MSMVPVADKLVWARVMRPRTPLVYLDLNHFIYPARANVGDGRAPSGYRELLAASTSAAAERRVVFPLSVAHVEEVLAINDPRQRRAIADVMEVLSGFQYLMGRPEIAHLELEAGIEDIVGEASAVPPLPLIGSSFGWAFCMVGGVRVVDGLGNDASDGVRREMGSEAYDEFVRLANRTFERAALDGPSDREVPILREQYGYAPETAQLGHQSRLDFELALSERLDKEPRWRRGRLRDVVAARELAHEWLDTFNKITEQRVGFALVVNPSTRPTRRCADSRRRCRTRRSPSA